MAEYINREELLESIRNGVGTDLQKLFAELCVRLAPTAEVVEVVRCKDCVHFQPCFVWTNDGERRPYTEEEIRNGKIVKGDVGINCGSRCERFGYWEENKIPVWYQENDFCSYGERGNKYVDEFMG